MQGFGEDCPVAGSGMENPNIKMHTGDFAFIAKREAGERCGLIRIVTRAG
jgi:hypothetical protein